MMNKQRPIAACVILCLTVCFAFVTQAGGAHTVYFLSTEPGVSAGDVRVHVWQRTEDGVDVPLNEWANNEGMRSTGNYYLYNGELLEVFEYSFDDSESWTAMPTHIIFHWGTGANGAQTDDMAYADGALYRWVSKKKGGIVDREPAPEFMQSYRLYFADTEGWGAGNVMVGSVSVDKMDARASLTGLSYKRGEKRVPVYSIDVIAAPGEAITFSRKDNPSVSFRTVMVESGLIICGEETADTAWEPVYRIYFADTGHWGSNGGSVLVHAWGTGGDLTPWASNEAMTPTGKYIMTGDIYTEVYQYSFRYEGCMEMVLFHGSSVARMTGDLAYVDGALYYYNGPKGVPAPLTEYELLDSKPVRPGSIYINLGANQIVQNLWQEPCAHLSSGGEMAVPERGSEQYNAEKMTMVRPGFYKIDVDNLCDYDDVLFYYYGQSSGAEANVFPASRSPYFDPTRWATYIYDIGTDCAHQSYITPERYEEISSEYHSTIYMVGNDMVSADHPNNTYHSVPVEEDEGVFFRKFRFAEGESTAAEFKLSWVNVKGEFDRLNYYKVFQEQRGWASYNLGIIGCNTEDTQEWRDEFLYSPGNGASRQIRIKKNHSMGYNNYVQYQWRLEAGDQTGIETGRDYWLVVDRHPDCHSVTVLDFDPDPEVSQSTFSVTSENVGYARARELHDGYGYHVASESEGAVFFDVVNVLNCDLTTTAPDDSSLGDDFTTVYKVYIEDNEVLSHQGVPKGLRLRYIAPEAVVVPAMRARYTDTKTGLSFCTHYSKTEVTPDVELAEPQLSTAFHILALGKVNGAKPGEYYRNAAWTLNYCLPADGPVSYPDFKVRCLSPIAVESGHLSGPEEIYHDTYPDGGYTAHRRWDDGSGEEYGDEHNWSKLAAAKEQGHLPLLVESVIDHYPESGDVVSLEAEVTAVYPFLVAPVAVAVAEDAPVMVRKADGEDSTETSDYQGYSVVTQNRVAAASQTFDSDTVTGVDRVSAESDGEAEYYDLSGRRVSGPAEAGVYLERRGSHTRKVVVL